MVALRSPARPVMLRDRQVRLSLAGAAFSAGFLFGSSFLFPLPVFADGTAGRPALMMLPATIMAPASFDPTPRRIRIVLPSLQERAESAVLTPERDPRSTAPPAPASPRPN
jgi:hypothetical protein